MTKIPQILAKKRWFFKYKIRFLSAKCPTFINKGSSVTVFMDWATIGLSVFLGAVVQTSIIIMLYNHYIIPHIIKGVKEELMISIEGWVDKMTGTLSEKIAAEINDNVLSLKRSIAGKRGSNSRLLSAAQSYLLENLSNDQDDPANEDIIVQAVAQYSKPIVDAVLDKIWPKKAVETTAAAQETATAGW